MARGTLRSNSILIAIGVGLVTLWLYDPFRLENTSGDSISTRYMATAIVTRGTVEITPFKRDLDGVHYAALFRSDGVWLPRIPFGVIPWSAPLFGVADFAGYRLEDPPGEWNHDRISTLARLAGILVALLANGAVWLLLLKLAARSGPMRSRVPEALALAGFAFGSWQWSQGAQGLTTQGIAVAAQALTYLVLFSRIRRPELCGLALGAGISVVLSVRPQDLIVVLPVLLAVRDRRALVVVAGVVGITAATIVTAQSAVFGEWGGYGGMLLRLSREAGTPMATFRSNPFPGFFGFLVSPNRGALWFWPLLFCLLPYGRALVSKLSRSRLRTWPPEGFILLGAAGYFVQVCFVDFWFAEWSFGPRYLYELAVPVALATAWCARAASPAWRAALGFALVWSIAVHALGARNFDPYVWHSASATPTRDRVWSFDDLLLLDTWEAGAVVDRPEQQGALHRLKLRGY